MNKIIKIVNLDKLTIPSLKFHFDFPYILKEFDNVQGEESILQAIADNEIVITCKTVLTREILEKCPNLKLITITATGYNNIDIVAARELGIVVCNAPKYSTNAVAQHAILAMLNLSGNFKTVQNNVKNWYQSDFFSMNLSSFEELNGKTLSIFGFGDIGKQVANYAKAFDMKIILVERKNATQIRENYTEFYEALAQADFLSLHCPLTNDNKHIISNKEFSIMKNSAHLINVSRGGLVDENALIEALTNKTIKGAFLDVLEIEPAQQNNVVLKNYHLDNLYLTPHIAFTSSQALNKLNEIVINNIQNFLKGQTTNQVN